MDMVGALAGLAEESGGSRLKIAAERSNSETFEPGEAALGEASPGDVDPVAANEISDKEGQGPVLGASFGAALQEIVLWPFSFAAVFAWLLQL